MSLETIDKEIEKVDNKIAYYQMRRKEIVEKYNKILDEGGQDDE